jgi:hypothetical protein
MPRFTNVVEEKSHEVPIIISYSSERSHTAQVRVY